MNNDNFKCDDPESSSQQAEKKYKLAVDMIKQGIESQNKTLIRGGITYLQTAAKSHDRAKECLCRLKSSINPRASHLVALQDPCKLHFSNFELNKLCSSAVISHL